MHAERLIVIGANAAGLSAASQARRRNPRLEIWVLERGSDISYSACGIPFFISGAVVQPDELRVYTPEFFQTQRNIKVITHRDAVEVNTSRHQVTVAGPGGKSETLGYDHLVLATGAEPASPAIPGVALEGVFHVNDLASAVRLKQFISSGQARAAAVIGGSYIGLEMADALTTAGLRVMLMERSPHLFEAVDGELAGRISQELTAHQVQVLTGVAVAALLGGSNGRVRQIVWEGQGGGSAAVDCVVLATGVRPRVGLAEQAGIRLGSTGALQVNEYMETSAAGVLAAGDCVECLDLVSDRPTYVPLGTTANKQGRVAGENATGGRARFQGIVGTAATRVFDLELARTGLSEAQARAAGFKPRAALARAHSRARYLGGREMMVKLIADPASGRLLGAQMAGAEGVAKRLDVFATALQARMTVEQVAQLDLSYAPPFAPVWDPVLVAAQQMLRELKR